MIKVSDDVLRVRAVTKSFVQNDLPSVQTVARGVIIVIAVLLRQRLVRREPRT